MSHYNLKFLQSYQVEKEEISQMETQKENGRQDRYSTREPSKPYTLGFNYTDLSN